ncbi:MAG: DUF3782 domain-containing protein [Spirochaetaceae bacterium]|jgi:hypothetical protein|nr:DUF3782 domain-containing protein [Spirochaetaceae bacterium]
MEATQTIGEGLTFEKVWASIQATRALIEENAQGFKKLQEENAQGFKELRESQKETEKQIKATEKQMKETEKQMKETDKRIGELGHRFGQMVEYMVVPNLVKQFRELGFAVTRAHQGTKVEDPEHDIFLEVDAFLENGGKVMIVEIKSKPNTRDIDDHVERMEKLRCHANLVGDRRAYLGAVAGAVFSTNVKTYALKNGFYVIEPSGDTFNITEPKGEYRPREWTSS